MPKEVNPNPGFAKRLKDSLKRAGITQKNLAEYADLRAATITSYTKHGVVPSWEDLVKIARKLNVSCDWLLTGDEPTDKSHKPPGPLSGPGGMTKQEEELLGKALEVLRSKSVEGAYDQALKSSIEALHAAVKHAGGAEKRQLGSPREKKAKRGTTKSAVS